jgi:DNA helicase HerA-like ATPase
MLSDLYERLPECGDLEKPKLVFFFDEAHLLFQDMPKVLLQKVEQIVRLIRSKGVGVYFISQSPLDIPELILGQLGNRVQHALRAFTPKDQRAIRAVGDTFRTNPGFDTAKALIGLGTGEALVSMLEADGSPAIVEKVAICPPQSDLKPLSYMDIKAIVDANTEMEAKYRQAKWDTSKEVSMKDNSEFEDHLYDLGRRVGRRAGSVLTKMMVRTLFYAFRGS